MAQGGFSKQQFWADLDELGVDAVREGVAIRQWNEVNHRASLAEEWLAQKERELRAASEAEQAALARTQTDAASRAATAAERAASAAERSAAIAERALATANAANTRATIALVIAAISIIAMIVIAYLRPS